MQSKTETPFQTGHQIELALNNQRPCPSVATRFQPGNRASRGRPKNAGRSILERINDFLASELLECDLRAIACNPGKSLVDRAAAIRCLRLIEFGDVADFVALLEGQQTMSEARAAGIDTSLIKRLKMARHTGGTGGAVNWSFEIELHDRSGQEFDRIVNFTSGKPCQSMEMSTGPEHCNGADGSGSINPWIRSLLEEADAMRAAGVCPACGQRLPEDSRQVPQAPA